MVAATNALLAKASNGIEVVPLVNIPLSGIDNASVLRGLLDFNCWLTGVTGNGGGGLPAARAAFWAAAKAESVGNATDSSGAYTLMLPGNARNPRKKPFVSEPVLDPLQAEIRAFSVCRGEREIGLYLGNNPSIILLLSDI